MSNSKLISCTLISPNKNSPRNHKIDTITIHCVVGQCSAERIGEIFKPTSRQASSNYGIGYDGRIDAKTVEQSYQSWRGHAEKGNSYHLIRRTDHYYNSLMKPKEAAQCQKH